jgi:hypothetical protein
VWSKPDSNSYVNPDSYSTASAFLADPDPNSHSNANTQGPVTELGGRSFSQRDRCRHSLMPLLCTRGVVYRTCLQRGI